MSPPDERITRLPFLATRVDGASARGRIARGPVGMETSHVFFFCPGSYRMPCVSDANSKKENSVRHATYMHDALLVAGTVVKKTLVRGFVL